MFLPVRLAVWAAALVLVLSAFALTNPPQAAESSDNELQLGVAAFKAGQHDEAMQHFQKAVSLDANNVNAHLYLATTLVQEYIPGVQSPNNVAYAEKAIDQYQHVLELDAPREAKINSNKGIAYLDLNMKKFEDAKKYYKAASELDPDDPESYYSIGVIDWTATYQPRMEARALLGMRPEEHLDAKNEDQRKACDELTAKNTPLIEEGIDNLNHAIQLRPDYEDAMAYMNLMFREKADVECHDLAARMEDLKTADEWVDKTLATRKLKAEKAANPATSQQTSSEPEKQ